MKRFFYIMFTCACALFGLVVSVNAAAPDGNYVTISYKIGGKTYYLAVTGSNNNYSITTTTVYGDNCVWIRTSNNTNTAFWSVSAEQYLCISPLNKDFSLGLTDESFAFVYDTYLYRLYEKRYYYVSFEDKICIKHVSS